MPIIAEGGSSFFSNIGGILSGIAELLVAIGAGIGFLIRSRRNARRERLRTEAAATLAAQETRRNLEARLEKQHADQIQMYKDQQAADAAEKANLIAQNTELQRANAVLINRLLGAPDGQGHTPS